LTLKFGKSQLKLDRPVRLGPQGGLTGVPCCQSDMRAPGGLTASRGQSNWVTLSLSIIRSLA
jgi:hypothetical protein